jgi:hypothetical protein
MYVRMSAGQLLKEKLGFVVKRVFKDDPRTARYTNFYQVGQELLYHVNEVVWVTAKFVKVVDEDENPGSVAQLAHCGDKHLVKILLARGAMTL